MFINSYYNVMINLKDITDDAFKVTVNCLTEVSP
uniref:Uncharacterized protein n=1 Tax=Acanthochromis polyacanthus TaxID=80966 RepID=A0A3Q1GY42_9TELE